jgi:serine protease AprX
VGDLWGRWTRGWPDIGGLLFAQGCRDPFYDHPTITAPGVNITATRTTMGIVINTFFAVDLFSLGAGAIWCAVASGTSMATPHVSGTVALMLEANPGLTPDPVKAVLEGTATPMPGYGQHEMGVGFLDAFEAVRAASGKAGLLSARRGNRPLRSLPPSFSVIFPTTTAEYPGLPNPAP